MFYWFLVRSYGDDCTAEIDCVESGLRTLYSLLFFAYRKDGNSSDPYDAEHWREGDADDKAIAEDDEGLHISNKGDVHYVPDEPEGKWLHWPTLAAYVGPGFLVCIAYLDPGNLEADLQTGAYTGYQLLWVLLLAHILGLVLQSLAARIGVVTGTHLADVCRTHYDRPAALLLWVMMEVAIIGSDIQEVLGSAIGLQILFGIPLWVGCLLTALDTFTFLFIHVFGVRKLEALFVVLVSIMTVAFFIDFFMSPPSPADVAEGFSFTAESYATVPALGLIGAVIMPHNIYLHSALVLSRVVDRTRPRKLWEATKYYTIDSGIALMVAFMINLAVVCTFAKQFYDETCATASEPSACFVGDSIDPTQPSYGSCDADGTGLCQEIGLSAAAAALRGTLGSSAKYVWAVGLLAAGQSSTMTGTYAGQFVMEGFLQLKIPKWQRVLVTRIIALGPALAVTVFMGGDIRATDRLSAWLNVLQSLQLPFAIIPLLTFCNSPHVMGEFTITSSMTAFVWMVSIGIIGINISIVLGFLFDEGISSEGAAAPWLYACTAIGASLYLGFILFLMREDLQKLRRRAESLFWELGRHDHMLRSTSDDGSLSPLEPGAGSEARHGQIQGAAVGDERRDGDDTRA
ncbi:divalent metal transporter [Ectocarpus siliculosus]|uniref:Divalent metal transporter n=1 Tax=Ectocarpus siliculosus TaxID=2880 RepID=D8LF38_ECTSI|nr:divalent metal transporter [Ectocarpus siliculosus]|eukprot:CBN78636.1 divalent metal transporter [Ectocarpus siliculosus]